MSDQVNSRFAPQNQKTNQRLSTNTVGLVALSDFRKRRAEVLEQQERETREAALSGASTPDRSQTPTPDNAAGSDSGARSSVGPAKKKKKKRVPLGKKLLSFGDEEEDESEADKPKPKKQAGGDGTSSDAAKAATDEESTIKGEGSTATSKFKANAAVGVIPRSVTKAALRKEAAERDELRREFLALQEAVKATEIAMPFVFYDGAHIPGGTVRLKKGDFVWVFLDRCRKVVANRKGGEHGHRRGWARAGVDDLMLVRDTVIIPHHYDFYYFVMNKSIGPGGRPLFDFSAEAPPGHDPVKSAPDAERLSTASTKAAAAASLPDISTLEGAADDPKMTKVVDRRWYARNKHIYPASTWQEFDPEKDYVNEIRKDMGGNTFFFTN
ncbi:hypothetical protein HIM_00976 [Hirsutella minnesotensis 3608]|nr:hypothetical protein HIM_00976 [Hirsutella minnesotensis 3608]